jgi:transcription elongation factor GreA
MSSQTQYVSADFLKKLNEDLHNLKTVKRREVAARIETAKALGDLSENAEYHEAKDELGFVEGRILEIEDLLKHAVVIEHNVKDGTNVRVGSTIKVRVNEKEKTYEIVGSNEADPLSGKVSNESPIGEALLGTHVGDTVNVKTPSGTTMYEVLEIS